MFAFDSKFLWPCIIAFGCIILLLIIIRVIQEKSHISSRRKSVLITGCDRGIGFHTALEIAEQGFLVFAGCRELTPEIIAKFQDVTNSSQFDDAFALVSQNSPNGLWAIINNAGIMTHSFVDFTPHEEYKKAMDVNFLGPVLCIKTFIPLLKKMGKGARIINTTSASVFFPYIQLSSYISSKAALDAFTRVASIELSLWGIICVQVSPGAHETTMITSLHQKIPSDDVLRERYGKVFLEEFKNDHQILSDAIKLFPGPTNVATVIGHVTASQNPWSRYIVGYDALLFAYPLSCLPDFVSDFVATFMMKALYSPIQEAT